MELVLDAVAGRRVCPAMDIASRYAQEGAFCRPRCCAGRDLRRSLVDQNPSPVWKRLSGKLANFLGEAFLAKIAVPA